MQMIRQTLSTLFLVVLFLLAVTMLYAAGADTEKVIIEENPRAIGEVDHDYVNDRGEVRTDRENPVVNETTIDENGNRKVRTTVTTVTETETVPGTAAPTHYDPNEDIEVDVQMDSHKFQPNEHVKGQIVVNNTAPEPLPATFHVKLYHDNKLFRHVRVQTKDKLIEPGITRYSLDEFGIPDLNKNRNYSGDWTIMVYQDDPRTSEEENFELEGINPGASQAVGERRAL